MSEEFNYWRDAYDSHEKRLSALETNYNNIVTQLSLVNERCQKIENRIKNIETKFNELYDEKKTELNGFKVRLNTQEEKLKELEQKIDSRTTIGGKFVNAVVEDWFRELDLTPLGREILELKVVLRDFFTEIDKVRDNNAPFKGMYFKHIINKLGSSESKDSVLDPHNRKINRKVGKELFEKKRFWKIRVLLFLRSYSLKNRIRIIKYFSKEKKNEKK